MSIRIRSIANLVEDSGIKILIHGPAGAGKTVMCCTSGEPTLIISAEAGLLSVRDAPKYIKGIVVESLHDLEEIYQYLYETSDEPDFKWVALDSITEIAEQILTFEKLNNKDPRKAYMDMQERVMTLLRQYRDLKGYNVVMSCKQQRTQEDGGPTLFGPMMPGQRLPQQISYMFDEVFALRVERDDQGNSYRVVQTSRDARYEAKDRSGSLDMFEQPSLKKIAEKIKNKKDDIAAHNSAAKKVVVEKDDQIITEEPVKNEEEPAGQNTTIDVEVEVISVE